MISDNDNGRVRLSFASHQTVKHLVESLRIPHTELGLILVNEHVSDETALLEAGDQVDIYPPRVHKPDIICDANLISIDQSKLDQIPPEILFLLDNHLGKLAVYLRMLGFDTWYRNDYQDQELAEIAEKTNRVLLTRDRGLLMRKSVKAGYCVRSLMPKQQLSEVLIRFDLFDKMHPFKRCLRCNSLLEKVDKDLIADRLLPLTRKYYNEFFICPNCNQIYWQGSHFDRMVGWIETLRQGSQQSE